MASRLIGSNERELLIVDTDDMTLSIKGRPTHPTAEGLGFFPEEIHERYCATLNIEGAITSAQCYDPQSETELRDSVPGLPAYACFFEQTTYQIVIENKTDCTLAFSHPHSHLQNAVTAVGRAKRVLAGNINLGNEVGLFTFEVLKEGITALKLTIEVFPSKLDYRSDYFNLIAEVNSEVYSLAYDFMRKTYLGAKLRNDKKATLSEFVSIAQVIFTRLTVSFNRIKTAPHQKIVTTYENIRVDKSRRTDNFVRKALIKQRSWTPADYGIRVGNRKLIPHSVLDARKIISYDTYENRVLKWMLNNTLKRLFETRTRLKFAGSEAQSLFLNTELSRMIKQLKAMLCEPFLANIGVISRFDASSLVLQLAPGYRDVYKYFLMLQKGLSVQGHIFNLSMKDVAQLYEYWCFLALGSIFRDKYEMKRQTAIAIKDRGLVVTLDTTASAQQEYVNTATGETYTLRYNPSQRNLPTTGQRPDNILTLNKTGSGVEYQYVLDAKYRIDPALPDSMYRSQYGAPGPQEDDVNTMHRYRDALVYRRIDKGYERSVFAAVVLFPYSKEAAYSGTDGSKPHRFFSSIDEVGVGGLPFLPGHTRLVEQFLDDLVLASPDTAYEKTIETGGTREYYEERFSKRNVLVGSVRSIDHLKWHLDSCSYHIPKSLLPKGFAHIEYVALYERKELSPLSSGIRYYSRVIDAKIAPRQKIGGPASRHTADYVHFNLEPWSMISPHITPVGYGVRSRIYTTLFLLLQARSLPELSLKSEVEMRVWKELRRLSINPRVSVSSEELDDAEVTGFDVDNIRVVAQKDILKIGDFELPPSILRSNPMTVLKLIMDLVRLN